MPFTLNRGKCRVSGGGRVLAGLPIAFNGQAVITGGGSTVASGVKQVLFHGEISFVGLNYATAENSTIQIPVTRQNGSNGAVTIDWALTGTSHNQSGQLSWGDGDPFDKQINITVGEVAADENGTVTLSNPTGGAVRVAPFMASLLITNTLVTSADWYVDGTNGNDSYDGTAETWQGGTVGPKQTIAAGILLLSGGQTLLIKGGVYTEHSLANNIPNGTAGNPTIIKGDPAAAVWVKSSGTITPGFALPGETSTISNAPSRIEYAFKFQNKQYITLDGVNLDGNGYRGWDGVKIEFTGCRDIIVQNSEIKEFCFNGILAAENFAGPMQFLNNYIHHNGSNRFFHGIYLGGDNHKVHDNIFAYNAGFGIQLFGASSRDDIEVFRNIAYGNGFGRGSGDPGASGFTTFGNRTKFYNNIAYENWDAGFDCWTSASDVEMYHNTVYNNAGGYGSAGIFVRGTGIVKNNLAYLDTISGGTQSGNYVGNPSFVNAGGGDFRLTFDSPARNQGVNLLSTVPTDIVGTPRDATPDAGAYEYL